MIQSTSSAKAKKLQEKKLGLVGKEKSKKVKMQFFFFLGSHCTSCEALL